MIFHKLDSGFHCVGFRIPSSRFQIPKLWITDVRGKNFLDTGVGITLRWAIECLKHKKREKIIFLAGKHNMKQVLIQDISCVHNLNLCPRVMGEFVFLAMNSVRHFLLLPFAGNVNLNLSVTYIYHNVVVVSSMW